VSIGAGDEADAERIDATDEDHQDVTYHHSPLVREFRRLKALRSPHRRGYDFQDFVGSLFKQQHFSVVPSAGTARPRQTDLLATRGDETYLIETKWRTSKADINDVESLFNRLDSSPPAVIGLLISYAGFTEEAIKKVELRSDRPVILLNGEELEQLVEWDRDIVQQLARKKAFLLTHRRVFFGGTGSERKPPRKGQLAVSPTEFVFLDGTRTKWIHGAGDFGQFTFVQELPDVDWVPAEGRSVTLDMAVPVYDERGIVALLHHLSDMGWATESARWSIQQTATNWHGMGVSAFAEALRGWRKRYKGIPTHHSEEFCYFDVCDGGFYTLTANISAHYDRSATYTTLSFQLTGIPLDTDSLKELARVFDVRQPCYFRPMERKSMIRKWHLREPDCVPLEPTAFITKKEDVFGTGEELVRGIVAKNPFYMPGSPFVERVPDWLPSHIFESGILICDLHSWHPLSEPRSRYELWGCESARTSDAVIVRPIAEWPDRKLNYTKERAPRRSNLGNRDPDRSSKTN
jgi:hypothetical protein